MNPTWNALTLLLTSTVLLLVTWMAATQRLAGVSDAGDSSADDPLLAMLVNFVGVMLALSGVLLFTVITVITDTVSSAWCTCHGVVLLFFTLMSAILLVLLAVSTWSLLYRGVRLESQVCGVRRAAALAAGMALGPTLLSALVGDFEQRTLFCFMYKPSAAALILFELPMLGLSALSTFFSVWTAMIILLRRRAAALPIFSAVPTTQQAPQPVEVSSSAAAPAAPTPPPLKSSPSFDEDEGEFHFLHAPDYERAMHTALGKFKFQTKLVTLLLLISISGLVGIVLEMIDSANWNGQHRQEGAYYHGQDGAAAGPVASVAATTAAKSGAAKPAASNAYQESQTGWAIIYLSFCGILVFGLLATGPGLWEVRRHYW